MGQQRAGMGQERAVCNGSGDLGGIGQERERELVCSRRELV